MSAGITWVDGVDAGRGAEAVRSVPLDAPCATLDWPLPDAACEQSVAPDVAAALGHALAACGTVAFRHDRPVPGALLYQPPPARTLLTRLLDVAGLGPDDFGLVVAAAPSAVEALFAHGGWSYAMQAALVFDPACDPAGFCAALRGGLDWRRRRLPDGARLLFCPGHDGDFATVAASDQAWLGRFKAALP